jgi:hypothetical protein
VAGQRMAELLRVFFLPRLTSCTRRPSGRYWSSGMVPMRVSISPARGPGSSPKGPLPEPVRARAGPTIRIRCLTVNRYGSGSRRLRADGPSLTPAYELLGSRFVATCPAGWVFRSAPRAF